MQLGKLVSFIRQTSQGVKEGQGVILAFAIAHDGRESAHINIGTEAVNVPMACLNPSEEFKEQFREYDRQFTALETEGRAENTRIVTDYNARLEALSETILGPKVKQDLVPEPAAIPEVAADPKPKPGHKKDKTSA